MTYTLENGLALDITMPDQPTCTIVPQPDQPCPNAAFQFAWPATAPGTDAHIQLSFTFPAVDIQYLWHPCCGFQRTLRVDWMSPLTTRLSSSAPMLCFFNSAGRSRFTIALSEVNREVSIHTGVHEEDGTLLVSASIPVNGATGCYCLKLLTDMSDISFALALDSVNHWWEHACGIAPMRVPEYARRPMYSSWYSFHQSVSDAEIEAECVRAAALGMHSVIVDDGWQTDDGNRGYAFCGDWQATPNKFPDMRAHVDAVHRLGMKYMLWYSVPFIGKNAEQWPRFSDKLLTYSERMGAGVLDPRYPDVRQYLIDTYVHAIRDWDLDGLKLDFIDSFRMGELAAQPNTDMDYNVLEDAVERLMVDVAAALARIKPDVLIEFRQSYIGPTMRKFGNMFRVGDCPYDVISNRVGVLDLRLLSGNTAVHSDMLMWHKYEPVEIAARQLLNVIFAVPQISVRLDVISEQHKRMLAFWLAFMAEHRELLLDAPLDVESPQTLYPLAWSAEGGRGVVALYESGHVATVHSECARELYLINAGASTQVVAAFEQPAAYSVEVFDCMGAIVNTFHLEPTQLCTLEIPVSGMAHLM